MDWYQLWEIATTPDNIPIVMMLFLIPFYTWYAFRQAFANDRLIARLEADPDLAKTHHRTVHPYKEGWPRLIHVWPYLLKREFLAAIIVTVILVVWSVALDAPLEEPANRNLTMNPAKAPWYFLGLQEMLVYFDPWLAGVVFPTAILIGLIAIPYCDTNPLGNGYYTFRQRKFAIWVFLFGFFLLWILLIVIGVFIRGPGWMWFWPGMSWDHHRLVDEINVHLHDLVGLKNEWGVGLFGAGVVGAYALVTGGIIHLLFTRFKREEYERMNIVQYLIMQSLLVSMIALPVKVLIRLIWNLKYIWVTPWFNV